MNTIITEENTIVRKKKKKLKKTKQTETNPLGVLCYAITPLSCAPEGSRALIKSSAVLSR